MQVVDPKEIGEAVAGCKRIQAIRGVIAIASLAAVRPRHKTSVPYELHLTRRYNGSALLLNGMISGLDGRAVPLSKELPVTRGH